MNPSGPFAERPRVVYLHRYPPEIEVFQWPGLRTLLTALEPEFELAYACLRPPRGRRDEELRRNLRMVELPFRVDQTSGRDKWLKTLGWYAGLGVLLRRIRALRPAAVICQEALPFIPDRVARLGFPTMIVTADWWWSVWLGDSRTGRRLANWLETREVRRWNRPRVAVTVSTQAGRRLLAERGLDESRITVVNMPRNPGLFRPLQPRPTKAELGLEESARHVAVFGIIRRGKGYEQLLDWWPSAVAQHPDWRLVIIGGAGGETWCRRELSRRGLDRTVRMTGWLPTKQEVNRWLNAMDALLVPRRHSPDNQGAIPSALFNGLSTGRPVVAAGLPGMAEIVRDGVDGFLFAPDDPASFLAAVERAAADSAAGAPVGRAGLARAAECFDPRRTAQSYRDLLIRLIHSADG